jgi:hypothetical protein
MQKYGVNYLWLIHPVNKTLKAYKLLKSEWHLQGSFSDGDSFKVEPFEMVELNVTELME